MDLPDPKKAAGRLEKISKLRPVLAMVLGSGFHHALKDLEVETKISYAKIPGFPQPSVAGHAGELYFGRLGGTPVLILSGRAHYYEGHSLATVTFAMRALAAFGVKDVLLTNAAGGINPKFRAGDFMMLTDHINFMGANPLRGPAEAGHARFLDLTETYSGDLQRVLRLAAKQARLPLRAGVYLAVSGPTYETPAEVRAFARLGADAVGMSTVPEAIIARHLGLRVAAVSCITNVAAGLGKSVLSHDEVMETAKGVQSAAASLLGNFAERHGQSTKN